MRVRRTAAGFSLIELIVVIGIIAVIAGATLPMVNKTITRGKIVETRTELAQIEPAVKAFFEDTGVFPPTFGDLEQDLAPTSGWAGPYTTALISGQPTPELDLSKDAWNNAYQVVQNGTSQLEITSLGPDATVDTADDLDQVVDVTPIRRAQTLTELRIVNSAITSYNAENLPATPLSTTYSTLLSELVTAGYLPTGTTRFDADGWGDAYVLDPPGNSPPVAVESINF